MKSEKKSLHYYLRWLKFSVWILALTVRFLTRRFITEYANGRDSAYVRNFTIQGRSIEVKIIDHGVKVCATWLNRRYMLEKLFLKQWECSKQKVCTSYLYHSLHITMPFIIHPSFQSSIILLYIIMLNNIYIHYFLLLCIPSEIHRTDFQLHQPLFHLLYKHYDITRSK